MRSVRMIRVNRLIRSRRLVAVVAAAALLAPITACGADPIAGVSAVGAQGTGEGAYQITALIPSAAGLVRNAPVLLADTTVGSVGNIEVSDWRAKVTVRLNAEVKVPEGSHAMIGMTSVLGSSHLAIVPPAEPNGKYVSAGGSLPMADCPKPGNLAAPAGKPVPNINQAQTVDPCRYPTTEQVLSSLSVVLNGGGLSRVGEVVQELSAAFGGRGEKLSTLIPKLNTLVTDLDEQTANIITASEGLDRLTAAINAQEATMQRALQSGPQILQLLVDQRQNLITALGAVGDLSSTANQILAKNSDDLKVIVPNMRQLLSQLASTGPALTNSLRILLTFPFLEESIDTVVKGDYVNSDLVLDLTFDRLNKTMMASIGLTGPEGLLGVSAREARKSANPLTEPFQGPWSPKPRQPDPSPKKKPAPSTKRGGN